MWHASYLIHMHHVTRMNYGAHLTHLDETRQHLFLRVPRLVLRQHYEKPNSTHMCGVPYSCVCHDSFIRVSWLIYMCDMKYMGWLRFGGALKLQVSFADYRLFYRALLQKRPEILKSLLIVATPYHDSFLCVPWLGHMCAMTSTYVCHDSVICVPWLLPMSGMTHS